MINFTVVGRSGFPVDMLRKDLCRPVGKTADEWNDLESSDKTFWLGQALFDIPGSKVRGINLVSDCVDHPNHHRWLSFDWMVVACTDHDGRPWTQAEINVVNRKAASSTWALEVQA